MGKFDRGGDRGGFGGGRGGFSKPRGFERGGDMPTYKATCAECSKSCDVPFRPTSGKPVYCNDCFGAKRDMEDRAPRKEFGNRAFGKPEFNRNDRPSFDRGGRDEFKGRSEFPARAAVAPAMNTEKLEKQMADISFKLEKLTEAIMKMSAPKAEVAAPKVAPVVEKKVEAKAAKPTAKAVVKTPAKAVAKKAAPAPKKVVAKKKK